MVCGSTDRIAFRFLEQLFGRLSGRHLGRLFDRSVSGYRSVGFSVIGLFRAVLNAFRLAVREAVRSVVRSVFLSLCHPAAIQAAVRTIGLLLFFFFG